MSNDEKHDLLDIAVPHTMTVIQMVADAGVCKTCFYASIMANLVVLLIEGGIEKDAIYEIVTSEFEEETIH